MKESIPKSVIRNRRNKIKEYTSEYNLTIEILADFFQVPIRVIESDIKAIKLVNPEFEIHKEGLKIFCIYLKKEEVRREVQKHIEEYGSSSRDWASVGFWMEAKQFGEAYKDIFKNVSNLHQRGILQHAYSLLKLGYTMDDTRLICSLKKVEMEILRNAMKNEKKVNQFEKWASEQYKNKKQRVDAETVKDAVGGSKFKLIQGDKYYYDVLKSQGKRPTTLEEPKYSKAKRDKVKEEAYEKWLNGETQQEIANSYEVDRVTIGNWIREIKAKKGELFSDEYRRNTSEKGRLKSKDDKADRRNACIKKIRPLIDQGATITAMSKLTGHCDETIKRYMKEAGLWDKYLEIRPELKKKK